MAKATKRVGRSKKTAIIEILYDRWLKKELKDGIVHNTDIQSALKEIKSTLSNANVANFLKDLVRKKTVVSNWPTRLVKAGISARQRYGDKRIFQFFKHPGSWNSPFPDWHSPDKNTPIYTVQSVSIDSLARNLGRSEESWIAQIAVNLHLVHTQLATYSPTNLRERIRDVRHLQMSVKTQPEIDAIFVASYKSQNLGGSEKNMLVTLEAKQRDERILIDQIREQVAKAFEITAHLVDPPIHAIKPMALQVVAWPYNGRCENMVFVVEFAHMWRRRFQARYAPSLDDEAIYRMKLRQVSATLYRFEPAFPALG